MLENTSLGCQGRSLDEYTLLCHLSPIVWAHKVHCFWHCPGPHLNLGNVSNRPWCPPGIVSTGPPAQINQGQVPGPHSSLIWSTAEATKAAQPRPQVHMPTKPVTAEATPVPAMDTPSVYSEVLPALNLYQGLGKYDSCFKALLGSR